MQENPDESELEIFQRRVSKVIMLQMQLDTGYRRNIFPLNIFRNAVDIPSIQAELRNWIPRSAQHLTYRITNWLFNEHKIAGSASGQDQSTSQAPQDDCTLCTLVEGYDGDTCVLLSHLERSVRCPHVLGGAMVTLTINQGR